jgi:outer membrane protein assembly factor BamB
MKNCLQIVATLFVTLLLQTTSDAQDKSAEFRHWTTKNGKRSDVRLQLLESTATEVRLLREDTGKQIVLPLAKLSPDDQQFLTAIRLPATAGDWPQWRGPNRDGKSAATGLLSEWPADGPKLVWNIDGFGEGYSTPAVAGEVMYLLGTRDNDEYLFAVNSSDGSQRWSARIGTKSGGGGFPGPKGTPTLDGDLIYAIGSDGSLVCLEREDGKPVWQKNLKQDLGGEHGHWDYAESPLIDGEKLICTPGGGSSTVVALNKSDGALIWKSPVGQLVNNEFARAGYASTIIATIAGTRQYVAFLHGGVVGIAAEDGTPLWHYDAPANGTANCSTPVVSGDSVFAASAYGTGGGRANIVRNGKDWTATEAYFEKKMENHHGGFVLHEGHIYGTNNSVLMCLDYESGEIKWQDRCVGKGSTTFAEGFLYVRGEGGEVALVEATPDEFRERGRFSQPDRSDKNAWSHPVVAGGHLYLLDHGRLLCYSIQ